MPTLHSACCVARLGSPCWAQLVPLGSCQGQATETPARDARSRPRGKMRGGGSGAHFAFLASGSLPIQSLPLQERATTPCSSWVSCCPGRGTPREDQCLGGQFAQDLGEEDCLGFGYELHGSSCSTLQWPHLSTHWTAHTFPSSRGIVLLRPLLLFTRLRLSGGWGGVGWGGLLWVLISSLLKYTNVQAIVSFFHSQICSKFKESLITRKIQLSREARPLPL